MHQDLYLCHENINCETILLNQRGFIKIDSNIHKSNARISNANDKQQILIIASLKINLVLKSQKVKM